MQKKNVLTIAGSDPSGGAGIQADIKSFHLSNVHGLSIITCVTAQNTIGVKKVNPLSLSVIESQIDSVFEDFRIDAVKTGMLFDGSITELVTKRLSEINIRPIVDPVMQSTNEVPLVKKSYISSLKNILIPNSVVVTPNIDEASKLSGIPISSVEDMEDACRIILELGGAYVVIKGGHLQGKSAVDVIFDGKKITKVKSTRLDGLNVHGSGCNFSALLTSNIALGDSPLIAVKKAKQQLLNLYATTYMPGKGLSVIDYSPKINLTLSQSKEHRDVAINLLNTIKKVIKILPVSVVPEVGINICYAIANAQNTNDICGIDGRIIKTKQGTTQCGRVSYGSSQHIAKIILTAMHHNIQYRAAMNIAYSPTTVEKCRESGLCVTSFSREKEPKNGHSSMEWGTN